MRNQDVFTLKIGGQAGQGVKSAGLILAKVATRSGYHILDYTEYPSLIRGGHNTMQISISEREVAAPFKKIALLIALNQETIDKHLEELEDGSGILFDADYDIDTTKISSTVSLYPLPFSKILSDSADSEILRDTAAIGAVVALLGGDLSILQNLIYEEFIDKGSIIVEKNNQVALTAFNHVKENYPDKIKNILTPKNTDPKMIVNGNDAVALGAIAGGLQFAAIYPMSPISGVLHTLAAHQETYGYIYKQPEDEISAINMAIGASFAGARSMTATSGGGFCLMTEGYGLAGMTETPIVIIEGMRPGPATGLPTWSEQGDLQFILHAHQGDFPRIVLAPGDAKETFYQTCEAFNLADKYQTPVVVLIDKNICENDQSFPFFDPSSSQIERGKFTTQKQEGYQRYKDSEDGISLRTVPGSDNFFIANSDEHTTLGLSSEEITDRDSQMKKRMAKLQTCARESMKAPTMYGPEEADITLISWGSNKGSILEALKEFNNVNFLHLTWLNPFPAEEVKRILEKSSYLIDIESNYSGQLAQLIKEKAGIEIKDKLLRYDGRPIFPEEIVEKIKSVLETVSPFIGRKQEKTEEEEVKILPQQEDLRPEKYD